MIKIDNHTLNSGLSTEKKESKLATDKTIHAVSAIGKKAGSRQQSHT